MKPKNLKRGKKLNRLINNNWNRNIFVDNLSKRFKLSNIKLLEIMPEYSSFIGNILYKNQNKPDMINSSIEINRRTFLYTQMYYKKQIEKQDIIFPEWEKNKTQINESLEEKVDLNFFSSWKQLYLYSKNSKLRYRIPLEDIPSKVFRLFYRKSYISLYSFL